MTTVSPEVIDKWKAEFDAIWDSMERRSDDCKGTALQWFILSRQSSVIELPDVVSIGKKRCVFESDLIDVLQSQGYQVNFNQPKQG